MLYLDGGERVGSEDEEDPDPHIVRMLAHPRVREFMRMTFRVGRANRLGRRRPAEPRPR